ncbi:Unknown protein sequence [Pseudomonas amygdali pv. lachrymans]|uniref:Uncharacterized protein n=1 Tax=Pseudomonas amygdali pv. lachrymans TaxID=53707 RepID=A0A0P9TS07_PSEAV|nr:Unknown protein sequence [Pseudomonas amygdali pv. lachrymans]
MLRCGEDVLRCTLFDHLALLDHHQLVAQRFDDSQVMADEQIRQIVLGLQRAKQLDDLTLYGPVEG